MITTEFLSTIKFSDYGNWLKLQDYETRCLYFGISANDCVIDSLIEKLLKNSKDHHILVAKDNGKWVGTIHIAVIGSQVEFGILVHKDYRGQGIANMILDQAIVWVRNRGYKELFMHCLTRNIAIRHLCEKHGLKTTNILSDSETKVNLAPPDIVTLTKESVYKQKNIFHMWLQDTKTFYQEIYG